MSIYFFSIHGLISQDADFSYPYAEKIYFNPAFAGLGICPEITLNYKKLFVNDFYAVSYNQYFKKISGGLALLILNDSQGKGTINNITAGVTYSYHIKFRKRKKLNFAFQVNYIQKNINTERLVFNDMIDPILSEVSLNTSENISYPVEKKIDFATAFIFISKKYRLGTALHHLNNIFSKKNNIIPFKLTIHAGKVLLINNIKKKESKLTIIPEIIYNKQSFFNYFSYGFILKKKYFLTSFYIKHNLKFHTFTPIFTFEVFIKNIRFSYTYDIMFSEYYNILLSSHRISLFFKINCIKKRKNNNTIYCR